MRRLAIIGSSLVLAGTVLAACGGDDKAGGSSTEAYCERVKAYKAETEAFDKVFESDDVPTADVMKQAFTTAQKGAKDLLKGVPSEIKADATLVSKGMDEMVALFEKHDWDIMALAASDDLEAFNTLIEDTDIEAASDRLDEFSEKTCGIPAES